MGIRKIKMMQSLIIVLLAFAAGCQARPEPSFVTSTGVDLEPIFLFLDDDGDSSVNQAELTALTNTGDADSDGEVTAAGFEAAWGDIAVGFGVPAENTPSTLNWLMESMVLMKTVKSLKPRTLPFSEDSTLMPAAEFPSKSSSTESNLYSIKRFRDFLENFLNFLVLRCCLFPLVWFCFIFRYPLFCFYKLCFANK